MGYVTVADARVERVKFIARARGGARVNDNSNTRKGKFTTSYPFTDTSDGRGNDGGTGA